MRLIFRLIFVEFDMSSDMLDEKRVFYVYKGVFFGGKVWKIFLGVGGMFV